MFGQKKLSQLYDASAKMMIMAFCPDWSISGPHCATRQIIKFVDVAGRYATNFATIMRDLITLITHIHDYTKYPEVCLFFYNLIIECLCCDVSSNIERLGSNGVSF